VLECYVEQYFRDSYVDFLNRLETDYNVSQMAVQEIATALMRIAGNVLSFSVKKTADKLGKECFKCQWQQKIA
jgi:hypothetical protein